jgi:hypothetical protein
MGKKVKVLGTANDTGVPGVEFDLAKIVQNAKARGLKWTSNANYRGKNGRSTDNSNFAVFACAMGASLLEEDTAGIAIAAGANDFPKDYEHFSELTESQALGIGYRLAMR